jgi:hypothetical protein
MVSKPASAWEKSSPELVASFRSVSSGRASDQSEENVRLAMLLREWKLFCGSAQAEHDLSPL